MAKIKNNESDFLNMAKDLPEEILYQLLKDEVLYSDKLKKLLDDAIKSYNDAVQAIPSNLAKARYAGFLSALLKERDNLKSAHKKKLSLANGRIKAAKSKITKKFGVGID